MRTKHTHWELCHAETFDARRGFRPLPLTIDGFSYSGERHQIVMQAWFSPANEVMVRFCARGTVRSYTVEGVTEHDRIAAEKRDGPLQAFLLEELEQWYAIDIWDE